MSRAPFSRGRRRRPGATVSPARALGKTLAAPVTNLQQGPVRFFRTSGFAGLLVYASVTSDIDRDTAVRSLAFTSLRRLAALAAAALLLAGCAAQDPEAGGDVFDPYEETNRDIHEFNKGLDRAIIRPASQGFDAAVPDPLETRLRMLAENFSLPGEIVNSALQLNMRAAFRDTGRLLVNTTLGLGGLFDPATEMGMAEPTGTGFGETLKAMGVREGPYLKLPVFGPATARGAVGVVGDFFTSPLMYVLGPPESYITTGAGVASGLSRRARMSETIDQIYYESEDSYAVSRSIYLQNRRFELGDTVSEGYADPYDSLPGEAAGGGAAGPGTELESPDE